MLKVMLVLFLFIVAASKLSKCRSNWGIIITALIRNISKLTGKENSQYLLRQKGATIFRVFVRKN